MYVVTVKSYKTIDCKKINSEIVLELFCLACTRDRTREAPPRSLLKIASHLHKVDISELLSFDTPTFCRQRHCWRCEPRVCVNMS